MPVDIATLKLLEGFLDQPGTPQRMLADAPVATAGRHRGAPTKHAEFVVTRDARRLVGVDHRVYPTQDFVDARATVDDIAEERRLAPRMAPGTALQTVAEQVEETVQGMYAAVGIVDQVVVASEAELRQSSPSRRLPQSSLARQIS